MSAKPNHAEAIMALVDFARQRKLEEAREACRVCHLPPEVRKQLRVASERGIRRKDQLEWIHRYYDPDITDAEVTAHRNGRHDG